MTSPARSAPVSPAHNMQQTIKWIVYAILIVNFGFYFVEDLDRAIHTLRDGASLFKITSEFATTIDELAWFALIAMFELETYWLEDEQWSKNVARTVHGVRMVAFVMIAHTVVAYADTTIDYAGTRPIDNVTTLCELVDDDVSYVYNLEYTEVTAENCAGLADAPAYFWLGDNPLVVTAEGLRLERNLASVDVTDAVTWLLIVFAMEIVVRLQGKGITGSRLMTAAKVTKGAGYAVLFAESMYWARYGHWLYCWDTFIWVAGFAAIELNVSDWRNELLQKRPGNDAKEAVTARQH